jgi:DNA-binding FadR family transcriptional regulator
MGDRVPSEMELAHLFGVSRITSKKALQTLNRDGVVERIIGKPCRRPRAHRNAPCEKAKR